jgi:hypothetical protein
VNAIDTAVSWAVAAGAHEAEVRRTWQVGRTAEIPTGRLWDVLRMTTRIGTDTLHRLKARDVRVGPILEVPARASLEILVPRGTSRVWPPLLNTVCVDRGAMRWPSPAMTVESGRRAPCGRRWIVAPSPHRQPATDADDLCETAAAALVHQATEWIPIYSAAAQRA